MSYCAKCGGTRVLLNGEPCECAVGVPDIYSDVACFDIPEQYRDISFMAELVPDEWNGSYRNFLNKLHTDISTASVKSRNWLICSPPRHAKTIFAYATMKRLFRKGLDVFPIYDALELRNKITQYDMGNKSDTADENLSDLFTAPYVFVKIPPLLNSEVFQLCTMIMDRRVRRGNSTIFLFNGTWERLVAADTFKSFTAYQGDGSYCTFSVNNWREVKSSESTSIC